jgi:hypothetical protein
MNYPMLYWFVSREFISFVKFALVALIALALFRGIRGLLRSAPDRTAKIRRLGWLLAFTVPVTAYLIGHEIAERREAARHWAERQAYVSAAWAHFKARCESAHVTYYKQVSRQEGVYIMKPTTAPTPEQFRDQYWMGDPYDLPDTAEYEARELLFSRQPRNNTNDAAIPRSEQGGFDYVEAPAPGQGEQHLRYSPKWKKKKNDAGSEYYIFDSEASKQPEVVSNRESMYGFKWEDISTNKDRYYWVAGGRMTVVNLETGELIAERIGYLIEPRFGSWSPTFNQSPWLSARSYPSRREEYHEQYQTVCERPLDGHKQFVTNRRELISKALGTWPVTESNGDRR